MLCNLWGAATTGITPPELRSVMAVLPYFHVYGTVAVLNWGMSETTSVGIANPMLGMRKAGSIGIPFPDMDVKLVDLETGTEEAPKGEPIKAMNIYFEVLPGGIKIVLPENCPLITSG